MMFCKTVIILVVCLLAAATAQEQKLVLDENFDDFNLNLWQHQITLAGGGNFEFQWYSNNRTNSYVEDGKLIITPTLTSDEIGLEGLWNGRLNIWGSTPADQCTGNFFYGCMRAGGPEGGYNILNPIKSASVRTVESFFFRYGRVEVSAKLPKGDWLWPAIWMLPRYNEYGGWPASGEIDIMEARGNAPGYPGGGSNQYGSTLHWGPDYSANGYPNTHQTFTANSDLSDDFHVYGFIWNETYIGTYFDTEDQVVLSVPIDQTFWERGGWGDTRYNPWQRSGDNAPFDTEFYLIINLAVGGTSSFFPDGYEKPWNNTSPHAVNEFWDDRANWLPTWTEPMAIDSVRVWTDPTQSSLATFNGAYHFTAGSLSHIIVVFALTFASFCF